MISTYLETYRGHRLSSEVASDCSFAYVSVVGPCDFGFNVYYDPFATRDTWFGLGRRCLATALRLTRKHLDKRIALREALPKIAAMNLESRRQFVCECASCKEYGYSHSRIIDIASAQEAAFDEAGVREVEAP